MLKCHSRDVFSAGVNTNNQVKTFAMHLYQTTTNSQLRDTLLNHNHTVNDNNAQFRDSITYLRANQPTIPLIMSEVGSALYKRDPQPTIGSLDNVFGSALWAADYLLYAMSLVSRSFTSPLSKPRPFEF